MKRITGLILLLILLIGALSLAACKPPQENTFDSTSQDSLKAMSGIPASDTELDTAVDVPDSNSQVQ